MKDIKEGIEIIEAEIAKLDQDSEEREKLTLLLDLINQAMATEEEE